MKPKKFFETRARSARMWASRWAAAAGELPFYFAGKPVGGVSAFDAALLATEWHARAELAEAYAKRAAEVSS